MSDQIKMSALIIPYDQLSPEALHGVIEEFVTRDGTDYGEVEVPLEIKMAQVLTQPNAPSYEDRFECLKYAYKAGFQTSVSIEPMLEYPRAQEMVDEMLPYTTDALWFGKMNHIKSFDSPDDDLKAELENVEAGHSDDNIKALYEIYGDNPKIKWKLAYKDVLGIPLPPAPGMDI